MKFRLQPAFSATAFCLSVSSLSLLSGCSAPINAESDVLDQALTLPTAPFSGTICMIGEDSIRLHVGDPLSTAQQAFPKPKRSFSITSVPVEFEEKYQVYGWENSGRSFAVLTQGGTVALGLDIHERVEDSYIETRVRNATDAFGPPSQTPTAGDIKYWFWEDGITRAMICVAVDTQKRKTISEAVGYSRLMDYLRMSPDAAEKDSETAFRTLINSKS